MTGLLQALFRFGLRIFFRRTVVLGGDHVPASGALVLVANHVNSLLDPLLLLCVAPRPVRFLAKAPLFRHPVVAPFLRALKALPVQRRQDAGADMARNARTFESCERALADGEAIALFPEGLSHDEPSLQPLKTGAARIVGRARLAGARDLTVLPVGLVYEAKATFRSDVTVIVGLPVENGDLAWGDGEAPEAVEALTARVDQALRAVTVNAERWEDLRFVEALRPMALELLGATEGQLPRAEARRLMLERYYRALEEHPDAVRLLILRARPYFRVLNVLGLTDDDVVREVTPGTALVYAWKRLTVAAVGYPPALFGWLANALPYYLTGPLAAVMGREEDLLATYKLAIGGVLFPIYYALVGFLLAPLTGFWPALALVLAALPAGLWSLSYFEHGQEFLHRTRAVLTLRSRGRATARLRLMRAEVLEALAPLVSMYR